MVHLKTTCSGIDAPIQSLQSLLYPLLKKVWGITDDIGWESYGRAYRNQTNDGYSPEVFVEGKEYKEVLFDDTLKVLSFFGVDEKGKYDKGSITEEVSLIFMVNIPLIKPSVQGRADEEVRRDVERVVRFRRYGFAFTGFETGIDNVFREYSGWKKIEGIKFRDQQPFHCFKVNFSLLYSVNNCY